MNKILETPRLFLREMTADDFDALYCVLADPGIMQHYPYAFDEERVRDWISRNFARYQRNGIGHGCAAVHRFRLCEKREFHAVQAVRQE